MGSEGRLFSDRYVSDLIESQRSGVDARVQRISNNEILSRPVDDLVEGLVHMFEMAVPTLDIEQAHVSQNEGMVEVPSRFANYGGARDTTRVMGTIVSLHIPSSGEERFFKVSPSTRDFSAPRAVIRDNEVTITVSGRKLSQEDVKQRLDEARDSIIRHLDWLRGAWSAPRPSTTAPFKPEPTLEETTYQEILGIVHNMALVMERSPTAFQWIGEEDLCQHFLVQLNGQFEGEASAETFSYQGFRTSSFASRGGTSSSQSASSGEAPKPFLKPSINY